MASIMAAPPPPALKYAACQNRQQAGLVSESALRIIVESKACFVALALALAYFLTASQHRLWSSSHLIKGFLFAVTQPVTRFLFGMFTMLLSMPFRSDLYLLWGILLLAGYEGVYTISGYGVSARRSDLAVHEFTRAYNIVTLGLYVRYYSSASQFRCPLWALWALMVAKFLERIVRFKVANGKYGDASVSLVADYMEQENKSDESVEAPSNGSVDHRDLCWKDCNYPIAGEDLCLKYCMESEAEAAGLVERQYEPPYKPAVETVTVAKVWNCQGELLTWEKHGEELRDVCLSFALCKLLRRKFAGVATAESERDKAQRLVFGNLLIGGGREARERTFRVVRTELGFARDMLYTKYPILFSSGFPAVSTALFVVTVGVSVWITVSAVRHYRVPHGSSSNVVHGKNVDLLITFVIVGMVTGMEICEFFIHLFSDWTKVMVVTAYVRKPRMREYPFLNCVLKFICCGKIKEPIGSSLGQFDLLRATKKQRHLPDRVVKLYHEVRSFVLLTGDEDFRVNKCKTLRPVPAAIEEMICTTLANNRVGLVGGQESLERRTELERHTQVSEHCKAETHIERIMVWHVATSTLELEYGGGGGGDQQPRVGGSDKHPMDLENGRQTQSKEGSESRRVDYYRLVATTLSKYCAYLVFYKPKLLPVAGNSVRYMCNALLKEAKEAGDGVEEAANGHVQRPTDDSPAKGGIVSKGQKLARGLESVLVHGGAGDGLWEALAELWCELIVSMAPHGSIGAHQKELGKGGEFITHLWALLYNAGIDDKFSGSSAAAAAAAATTDASPGTVTDTTTTAGIATASSA